MADVTYVRPELIDASIDYEKIEDCCAGQRKVKSKGPIYLPVPDPDEPDNKARDNRYFSYIGRALFINFTGRTLEGFTGLVFNKEPVVEIPKLCEVVKKNADGSGVSLTQQAKVAVQHVIKKGRAGLLVDYPMTAKPASIADMENGDIRPVILIYDPRDVINWDVGTRGAKVYLTLIVLKETYSERIAGDFEVKTKEQYRVLELVNAITGEREVEKLSPNSIYKQTIYRKDGGTFVSGIPVFPKDGQDKFLEEIPFTFLGASTNNASIDKAPLIDIADANIGHYINSADWEESCFTLGQPTLAVSGITTAYYNDIYKGKEIRMGSRNGIVLPPDGEAKILQPQPNTMAADGMDKKKEYIVSLGAKIIEEGHVAKTATEDTNDSMTENSVLGTIAANVETGFKWGLEWCAIFTGEISQNRDAMDQSIKFQLNKKFDQSHMTAADRAQLLKEWLADAISKTEYRRNLRTSGVELDSDETAEAEIKKEQDDAIKFEVDRNKALAVEGVGNAANSDPTSKKTNISQAA